MLERGSVGFLNGRYCWVKGFWLAGDHLHGRVSFDMMAGLYMAPCVWPRASGRHGLGTGGLLERRVCACGLPNSRFCWVKGFWLAEDRLHARVSFDMVAGFSMAPCIWDRASGRHGLGTGGLLEGRVCAGG